MPDITVSLPDGSAKSVHDGASVHDVAEAISPRLAAAAIAGKVDGVLVDIGRVVRDGVSVEIVTDRGNFLSIPNEAIIEEGSRRVVYVQRQEGRYEPAVIGTGIQGELFTEVREGLVDGEQVVTFGSFFIDAEYKLKGLASSPR